MLTTLTPAQNSYPCLDFLIKNRFPNMPYGLWEDATRALDEIDELRAQIWKLEQPERERKKTMDWWKQQGVNACKRGNHTPSVSWQRSGSPCQRCGVHVPYDPIDSIL